MVRELLARADMTIEQWRYQTVLSFTFRGDILSETKRVRTASCDELDNNSDMRRGSGSVSHGRMSNPRNPANDLKRSMSWRLTKLMSTATAPAPVPETSEFSSDEFRHLVYERITGQISEQEALNRYDKLLREIRKQGVFTKILRELFPSLRF
jgi:hypothetical protein